MFDDQLPVWPHFLLAIYGPIHMGLVLLKAVPGFITEVKEDVKKIKDSIITKIL